MFNLLVHPSTLIVIIFYVLFKFINKQSKGSKLPPGPSWHWPFIGDTISYLRPHLSSSNGQLINTYIKRYGKIFTSHLFGHKTIISCDTEFNYFILQNNESFKNSYPKTVSKVFGDLTLISVNGDVHKRIRGAALNLFSTMRNQSTFVTDIEEDAIKLMNSWSDKKIVSFCSEARKFTFGVIVKQVLSLGPDDEDTKKTLKNFSRLFAGLVALPINIAGTTYANSIEAKLEILDIMKKIQKQREIGDKKIDGRTDFFDVLLANKELSDDERLNLVFDLITGGYETTSMLISTIVKYLGENQELISKLREEHLSFLRNKVSNQALSRDDYINMKFTQCIISEALRLGNVVHSVHRETVKTVRYKGYEIPPGWKIYPMFSAVHLDSSIHQDPLHFNPSRWMKDEMKINPKILTPFGGGKRLCPGYEVAKLEACIFLHHLVLWYSWKPLKEDDWPMCLPYSDFKHGLEIAIQSLELPHISDHI